MDEGSAQAPELQRYFEEMRLRNLAPYWEVIQKVGPSAPPRKCDPVAWRYEKDVRPYLLEAAKLISAEDAERRVLIMTNPGLPLGCVTPSLCAAVQLILPGEAARPHRHTQAAFRVIFEGDGAQTIVDGEPVTMSFGDFIVTPSWSWHEHSNETDHPVIWFDGLDQPLVGYFGANFHQSGAGVQLPNARPADDGLARFGSGTLPLGPVTSTKASPLLSYPYARTRAALEKMRAAEDWDPSHGLKVKYANPLTGDYVLPTIAAFAQLLPKGFHSVPYRSTESAVQIILEGRGRTVVAGQEFSWGPRDIVVVPNWCWTEIVAEEDAVIFTYSDRAVLEKLGLWREERGAAA